MRAPETAHHSRRPNILAGPGSLFRYTHSKGYARDGILLGSHAMEFLSRSGMSVALWNFCLAPECLSCSGLSHIVE